MGLYGNIKDRVRRNSLFPARALEQQDAPKSPPWAPTSSRRRPATAGQISESSASRHLSASPPTRPPRPASLALSSLVTHESAPVPPRAEPSSLAVPSLTEDTTSYSVSRAGPHAASAAWFVPVPILDPKVYAFEYQFGGTLGEGGFGKVLLALNLETRQEHAIKVIALRRLRSRRETGSIANEIKVLRRVAQTACPFLGRPGRRHDWYWQYRGNVHLVMVHSYPSVAVYVSLEANIITGVLSRWGPGSKCG